MSVILAHRDNGQFSSIKSLKFNQKIVDRRVRVMEGEIMTQAIDESSLSAGILQIVDQAKQSRKVGVGGFKFTERELGYVNQVIASSHLSYGPMSQTFETRIAKAHGCKYGLFMNSGTSALHVALAALKIVYGWNDGDEVIVPATTFVATINVVLHNNLTPVFVDVDPDTFAMDPSKIEEVITSKSRCILPVHLLGLPSDMEPIMDIANEYNLRVVEDSCETMFAEYKGKPVGSFGDVACFSTYVAHFLVTGVGGLAITNDSHLNGVMRSLMNHGRDIAYTSIMDDDDLTEDELQSVVAARFRFMHLGHSFRATELEAAIGLGQLDNVDQILSSRKSNAVYLTTRLEELDDYLSLPKTPSDRSHSFMLYGIKTKREGIGSNSYSSTHNP